MKKTLVMALVLLLAISQTVSAGFYPVASPVYQAVYTMDFTKANEQAGKFTVRWNSNEKLEGDGYETSYLEDENDYVKKGIKLTALNASSGSVAGLVHGDGFQIPAEYAGFPGADTTNMVTFYQEFTVDMKNMSSSGYYRVHTLGEDGKKIHRVDIRPGSVEYFRNDDKVGETYTLSSEEKKKPVTIGLIYVPYTGGPNPYYGMCVNGKVAVGVRAVWTDKKRIPTGYLQFYFHSCGKGDEFVIQNYKSYSSEAGFDPNGLPSANAISSMTKVQDIDFSVASTQGEAAKLILPSTLGTEFTAEDNYEAVGEAKQGIRLTATEEGGLGDITIPAKNYGTNATYTHYWEFTADISQLHLWDGYRIYYDARDYSDASKPLCTLSISSRDIALGYYCKWTEEVEGKQESRSNDGIGESHHGYIGIYQLPEDMDKTNVRIGVSYDPDTKELQALINGEVIISGTCDDEKVISYISGLYKYIGEIRFHNMFNESAGAAFTLKSMNCGYYITAKKPAEGALTGTVSTDTEGTKATATATLSKAGDDKGYYDNPVLYVAVYGADKMLKSVAATNIYVQGGDKDKVFTAETGDYEDGCSVKAFLWEKGTLKPVALAE